MLTLDREFEDMEAKIQVLESEKLHLQSEVGPLKRQVDQLQEKIQRIEAKAAATVRKPLEEKAEKLLLAIANSGNFPDRNVPATIGSAKRAEADYYIGVLRNRHYIKSPFNYTAHTTTHVATHSGLEYLHEKGLL